MSIKFVSLHPKLAAVVDALLGLGLLWLLVFINEWWTLLAWFALRLLLWGGLVQVVYFPKGVGRLRLFLTLSFFLLGATMFLIFVDRSFGWYILGTVFVLAAPISFWLFPAEENELSFVTKPYRRWRFIMSLFAVAGIWSGASAILSLRVFDVGDWPWIVLASVFNTGAALWWWLEYGVEKNKKLLIWTLIWLILMIELCWVMFLTPLGFLVNGLAMSWMWYILWLFTRFHLSKEGVDWGKQTYFLATNVILLTLFLILVAQWK